jgi:hypothetical protein
VADLSAAPLKELTVRTRHWNDAAAHKSTSSLNVSGWRPTVRIVVVVNIPGASGGRRVMSVRSFSHHTPAADMPDDMALLRNLTPRPNVLIPGEAAHHSGMKPPAIPR